MRRRVAQREHLHLLNEHRPVYSRLRVCAQGDIHVHNHHVPFFCTSLTALTFTAASSSSAGLLALPRSTSVAVTWVHSGHGDGLLWPCHVAFTRGHHAVVGNVGRFRARARRTKEFSDCQETENENLARRLCLRGWWRSSLRHCGRCVAILQAMTSCLQVDK